MSLLKVCPGMTYFDIGSGGPVDPCCPRCGMPLSFHQPEPGLPGRLLATCSECDAWYLAEIDEAKARGSLEFICGTEPDRLASWAG